MSWVEWTWLTWQPSAARRNVRMVGDTGAAPVMMSLTRPPRLACAWETFYFYIFLLNKWKKYASVEQTKKTRVLVYLHFLEDEFVPQAVRSDHAAFKLRLLPSESKIEQPFLQRRVGLTKYLWVDQKSFILISTLERAKNEAADHRNGSKSAIKSVEKTKSRGFYWLQLL